VDDIPGPRFRSLTEAVGKDIDNNLDGDRDGAPSVALVTALDLLGIFASPDQLTNDDFGLLNDLA
jgi:hypothetical protein